MVESIHVRNGMIAGIASGLVAALLLYLNLPSIDEVIQTVNRYYPQALEGIPRDVVRAYISIALKASGLALAVIMTIIGSIFGWIGELLSKRLGDAVASLTSGLILSTILVAPNLVLGGDPVNTMINVATGLSYTIVYFTATMLLPGGGE